MTKLTMNEQLLSVICLVQSAKKLFLNELDLNRYNTAIADQSYTDGMKSKDDWVTRTRNYFFSLDSAFLTSLGLAKNLYCFDAIMDYPVTDEHTNTNYEDLSRFTFSY